MIPAFVLSLIAAVAGWLRAARRGGNTADRFQFAAAHGIAGFLVGMLVMTAVVHMGWLG